MPTVPRYNRQTTETATPTVAFDTEMPIEALGGGTPLNNALDASQRLNTQAQKMMVQEKQNADDARLQSMDVELIREINRLKHDPNVGALNKLGENAFNVTDEYNKELDKFVSQKSSLLNNPEQQSMWGQIVAKRKNDFIDDLNRHTSRERERYAVDLDKAGFEVKVEDALLNARYYGDLTPDNPRIASSENDIVTLDSDFSQKMGLSSEKAHTQKRNKVSDLHTRVVSDIKNREGILKARDYFKQAQAYDKINDGDAQKIAGWLKDPGENIKAALNFVDDTNGREAVPQELLRELGPDRRMVEDYRNLKAQGQTRVRDTALHTGFIRMSFENPAKFLTINFENYNKFLDQSDIEGLTKTQRDMKKDADGSAKTIASVNVLIEDAFKQNKIHPSVMAEKAAKSEADQVMSFAKNTLRTEMNNYIIKNGKEMPAPLQQERAYELARSNQDRFLGIIDLGDRVPVIKELVEEAVEIPNEISTEINRMYRSYNGIDLTQEQILEEYKSIGDEQISKVKSQYKKKTGVPITDAEAVRILSKRKYKAR
jgi:hypothetical protein